MKKLVDKNIRNITMDVEFKNHSQLTKKEKKSKQFWKNSRLIKKGLAIIKPPKLVRIKPRGLTRAQRIENLLEKRELERIEQAKQAALERKEKLKAEKAAAKAPQEPKLPEIDCTNITFPCQVFISNLPSKTTKQLIMEHFQNLCKLDDIQLPIDKKTKKSRGFGFINISEESQLKDLWKLKELKFRDHDLTIKVKGHEEEASA